MFLFLGFLATQIANNWQMFANYIFKSFLFFSKVDLLAALGIFFVLNPLLASKRLKNMQ
jgi:hypothetical protein